MTTYQYRCPRCSQTSDLPGRSRDLRSVSPPEVVACPFCGCQEARRQYAAPTVIYKATGFTGAGARPRENGIQRR